MPFRRTRWQRPLRVSTGVIRVACWQDQGVPKVASVAMYLAAADVDQLVARIDEDDDLAWIVDVDGVPGGWVAKSRVDEIRQNTVLWHVPSGPLPLMFAEEYGGRQWINEPWLGWTEHRAGGNAGEPYFGGHPGVYCLCLTTGSPLLRDASEIGLSSLGWIANRYKSLGREADPGTAKHWQSLRRWIVKTGKPVAVDRAGSEVYAFPAAAAAIESGAPHEAVPFAATQGKAHGRNPVVWTRSGN